MCQYLENDDNGVDDDGDGDGDIDDDVEQDEFCIRDDLGATLDQSLGEEELEELILEGRGECFRQWFAIMDLMDWYLRWFPMKKSIENIIKCIVIMPLPTSRILK